MHSRLRLALLALSSCLPALAQADQCPTGYIHANITGRVNTINLSQTKQVGQICLTAVANDGRELYDECGAVVGKVVASDPTTGASTLTHTALFELPSAFQTANDQMQITGVLETDPDGAPCALSVVEQMTKLKWGTGIFTGAILKVGGQGTINFCPGTNQNNFQLAGEGCIRRR